MPDKRIKIAYVHHGKGIGGAALSLLYLVESLDKTIYHPVVIFLYNSPAVALFQEHKIDSIGPLNVMDFPHTKIWWLRWYHALTLMQSIGNTVKTVRFIAPKIFNQLKPDIVHLNTSSLIGWAWAARKMGIPVVWHIREPLADGYVGMRKALVRNVIKHKANAIVAICKDNALPWHDNSKTHVVYNAVPSNRFHDNQSINGFAKRYNLDEQAPKILFLGGISQEKGTHIILNVFQRLYQAIPEAKLLIAGNDDLDMPPLYSIKHLFPAARYKFQIKKQLELLAESVVVLGPILDVPAAMAASSVIVFPATVGHFARPVIEAGFMKKPSLASNLPPLDELIIDGKTGFLIDPYDTAQWVDKLTLVLTDKKLATTMGCSAYEFCVQHFNCERHVSAIGNIYSTLIREGDTQ